MISRDEMDLLEGFKKQPEGIDAKNQSIESFVDALEDLLKKSDFHEISMNRGIREKTRPRDVWRSYEPNGTYTFVVKINGGSRDETLDGGPVL